jgi:hypothetical protein
MKPTILICPIVVQILYSLHHLFTEMVSKYMVIIGECIYQRKVTTTKPFIPKQVGVG